MRHRLAACVRPADAIAALVVAAPYAETWAGNSFASPVESSEKPPSVALTSPPFTNWMRSVDPAVMGLRAERTPLPSLGDDECRFAVLETDDPLASYTDKVEQRFVDKPESG